MTADPLSREAALQRIKAAGVASGKFGTPADRNPYQGKPSMREEFDKWEAGRQIGASERKAGRR